MWPPLSLRPAHRRNPPRDRVAHGPTSSTLPAWLQRAGRRTTSRSLLCASAHPPRTPWISPCRPTSPAPPGHDCSQRSTRSIPCAAPAVVPRCGSSPSLPIPSRSSGSSATSSRPARPHRDSTPLPLVDSPPPRSHARQILAPARAVQPSYGLRSPSPPLCASTRHLVSPSLTVSCPLPAALRAELLSGLPRSPCQEL
jgi:hypothetical protein